MKTIIKTIIPTAVLQEVMDAMDDMATDSRLLDMKQSRVHGFDAARDALRAALDNLQCGCEQNLNTIPAGWKLVPVELTHEMLRVGRDAHYEAEKRIQDQDAWSPGGFAKRVVRAEHVFQAMLASAPQPPALERVQPDQGPYLWYDPENGDTWTQEAVDEGFCATDSLIPLYTK